MKENLRLVEYALGSIMTSKQLSPGMYSIDRPKASFGIAEIIRYYILVPEIAKEGNLFSGCSYLGLSTCGGQIIGVIYYFEYHYRKTLGSRWLVRSPIFLKA